MREEKEAFQGCLWLNLAPGYGPRAKRKSRSVLVPCKEKKRRKSCKTAINLVPWERSSQQPHKIPHKVVCCFGGREQHIISACLAGIGLVTIGVRVTGKYNTHLFVCAGKLERHLTDCMAPTLSPQPTLSLWLFLPLFSRDAGSIMVRGAPCMGRR